jgi:hypothetical protein
MIHLNRCIEQAWRRTIEETASVSGGVAEVARVNARIALDEEMGDAALAMLERVLAGEFEGFEPWDRDEQGRYLCRLGEVTMIYNPASQQLTVEAQLSEVVTAEARGAAEAGGFTVGEVAVEAMQSYYDDGWGGRTKEGAQAEAQKEAEKKLEKAIEALHLQQHENELLDAGRRAQAEARAKAEAELAQRQDETRKALRGRLQSIVAEAQERVAHVMNRAVGEAYRQTLRELVLANGGQILTDEQTGSVINMELELY